MRTNLQTCTLAALLAAALAPLPAAAQERRDSTRGAAAITAEEMHRIRRAWLEQRRLGELGMGRTTFGSAVVGAPRAGVATGVGAPLGAGSPYGGSHGWRGGPGGFGPGGFGPGGFGPDGFGPGGFGPGGFGPGGFGCDRDGLAGRATGRAPWSGWSSGVACVSGHGFDGGRFGRWPGDRLPYPAYPLYGRFYDRFNDDARNRYRWTDPLLYGVREYDWGWYGPWQTYPGPLGWSDGAYGWYSAAPYSQAPSDCVDLTLLLANGRSHRLVIGLQPLGLSDARDLDLAIDARLSEGLPVLLQGLDGRVLRIEPGTPIDDILVRPCSG
jgi:hypothetical protein